MPTSEGEIVLQRVRGIHVWDTDPDRVAVAGQVWLYENHLYHCVADDDRTGNTPDDNHNFQNVVGGNVRIRAEFSYTDSDNEHDWVPAAERLPGMLWMRIGVVDGVWLTFNLSTESVIPIGIYEENQRSHYNRIWFWQGQLYYSTNYDDGTGGTPDVNTNFRQMTNGGGGTAVQVRDRLQTLTGDDRLDASAVKNIPPAGGEAYTEGDGIDITGTEISVDDDYVRGLVGQEWPVSAILVHKDHNSFPDGTDPQWTAESDINGERILILPPDGLTDYISELQDGDRVQIQSESGTYHNILTMNTDASGPDSDGVYTLSGTFSDSLVLVNDRNYTLLFSRPTDTTASHIAVPGSSFDGHLEPTSGSPTDNLLQALQKLDDIPDLEDVHIVSVTSETTLNEIDTEHTVAFAHIDANFEVTENGNTVEYKLGEVWIWDTLEENGGEWVRFLEDVRDHLRGAWDENAEYAAADFVTYNGLYYFTVSSTGPRPGVITPEPDSSAGTWRPLTYRTLNDEDILANTSQEARTVSAVAFNTGARALFPTMTFDEAEAGTGLDRRSIQAIVLHRGSQHAIPVISQTDAEAGTATDQRSVTAERLFESARAALPAMSLIEGGLGTETIARSITAAVLRNTIRAIGPKVEHLLASQVTHTSDAIALTPTNTITAYFQELIYIFRTKRANTGAITVNVDSVGARALVKADGSAFASGDLASGVTIPIVYDTDNTRFVAYTQ